MAKIVIKDLATELGLSNKDVLAIAAEKGIEAKAYNSSVEESDAARIRAAAKGEKSPAPAKKEKEAAAPAKAPVNVNRVCRTTEVSFVIDDKSF